MFNLSSMAELKPDTPGLESFLDRLFHGASRRLYLFCTTLRHLDEIVAASGIPAEKIVHFLTELADKHLVFVDRDQNRFLSLAVRRRN